MTKQDLLRANNIATEIANIDIMIVILGQMNDLSVEISGSNFYMCKGIDDSEQLFKYGDKVISFSLPGYEEMQKKYLNEFIGVMNKCREELQSEFNSI